MYKSASKILSENLLVLMKRNGVDQQKLAKALNVSQASISNWLNEIKYPRISKIQKIAIFFNVSTNELTEDKGIQKNTTNTSRDFSNIVAAHIDDNATDEDKEEILAYIKMKMELRRKRKENIR